MLTLFTIPKAFVGHIGIIQQNALQSWCRLDPRPEIILFGNDAGVAGAAKEFGVRHEPAIRANEHGTPLVSDAFGRAAAMAHSDLLMFSNADMLFDGSLGRALPAFQAFPQFLASGRRWDIDLPRSLAGADGEAWRRLFAERSNDDRLHGPAGMDYFLFPRKIAFDMPEFAVGRVGWDSWMVWKCRMTGIPVVDATESITALHQNHDYTQLKLGRQHERGPERELNIRAAGGLANMLTLREADWRLVDGRVSRPRWNSRWFALAARNPVYRLLLACRRRIKSRLG